MPRVTTNLNDPAILEATLEGLMLQKQRIEAQIQEVRLLLGRKRPAARFVEQAEAGAKKRELSDSARKRIAAAQKKRWAEYRKRPKAE